MIRTSEQQNSPLVINRCGGVILSSDRTTQSHGEANHTVDLLSGLPLVRLDRKYAISLAEYETRHLGTRRIVKIQGLVPRTGKFAE